MTTDKPISSGELKEGNSAPDFSFRSGNQTMKLSGFKERKVVLYFYPRDFTTGCTTEASRDVPLGSTVATHTGTLRPRT